MGHFRLRFTIASALLAGALVACAGSHRSEKNRGTDGTVANRSINEVLAAHTDSLMKLPGVVGTAVGLCDGERCIKVLLADSNPETKRKIPARLEGYRVTVEVTGTIKPQ